MLILFYGREAKYISMYFRLNVAIYNEFMEPVAQANVYTELIKLERKS